MRRNMDNKPAVLLPIPKALVEEVRRIRENAPRDNDLAETNASRGALGRSTATSTDSVWNDALSRLKTATMPPSTPAQLLPDPKFQSRPWGVVDAKPAV